MKTADQIIANKSEIRNRAINKLVLEAQENGENEDRIVHTLNYDYNIAPMTTNRQQLLDIGITLPRFVDVPPDSLSDVLKVMVDGLALYKVFLLHTNHLDDAQFYIILSSIIDENVRDVVPQSGDCHEYVDLVGNNPEAMQNFYEKPILPFKSNRDSWLPKPDDTTGCSQLSVFSV